MILGIVDLVNLDLLVLCQRPLSVYNVLVVICAWFELEGHFPILVNLFEVQFRWMFPVIPCTWYHDLFWTRYFVRLKAEQMWLDLESWSSFQDLFKAPFDLPGFLPILSFL